MVRKIKPPDRATVMELLKATLIPDMKLATKAFKDFERGYETYPRFALEDAERIYQECTQIIRTSDNAILRYNALRLLKYAVITEDLLRTRADDIWALYKETIFDPDGNVRNAGFQLLSRFRFGMVLISEPFSLKKRKRNKKQIEEENRFQKMFLDQCIELFEVEKRYMREHATAPGIEEELRYKGRPRGSWDTKESYLKTIRRGMEEATRYASIEELAVKNGYELPNHWLFEGQIQEQEDEWPPGTEEDIAGVLIDPKGNMPMAISDPPDPKSFTSFEEYQEALTMRDVFLEKANAVSDVLSSNKSEEEIEMAMKALGFQKHDDAPCNRKWCIERYGCVAITLVDLLREIDDYFLGDSFIPKNQLLSREEMERCEHFDCHALPQKWFVGKTREHAVFRWFMNLMDMLGWNERRVPFVSLAQDPVECAFVREAYLFTLSELRGRPWGTEYEGKGFIQGFLKENDLLRSEDALSFLKEFEGFSLKKRKIS